MGSAPRLPNEVWNEILSCFDVNRELREPIGTSRHLKLLGRRNVLQRLRMLVSIYWTGCVLGRRS